MFVIVFKV